MRRIISAILLNTLALSTAVQASLPEEPLTPGKLAKRVFNSVFDPSSDRVFKHFSFSETELSVLGLDPDIIYWKSKEPMSVEELPEDEEPKTTANLRLQAIQHIDAVMREVEGRSAPGKNTHLALLHVIGVNYIADLGFDEESERPVNGKQFFFSNACPAFERRCRAASQQFMMLADDLKAKELQQGSLKMLSLSLAMLRLPIESVLGDQFYNCQLIQTGLVAREIFNRMESLVAKNRSLIPGNLDWFFCRPFSTGTDPRLTTTGWQIIALKLADTSCEQKAIREKRGAVDKHYSYEHVHDMVPLYIRAAKLAEAEAGYSDGEGKALNLKLAHSFWMGLYWVVKKWDAAEKNADDSEGEPYWPEAKRLGMAAYEQFLKAGLELLQQSSNNKHAAEVYFESFHLRISLPTTPEEDVPNALACLASVKTGVERFTAAGVDLEFCSNFYTHQSVSKGADVLHYANQRVYKALWDLFAKQMQTYAGPKVRTKAELIDQYLRARADGLEQINPELRSALVVRCSAQELIDPYIQAHAAALAQINPELRSALVERCFEVLEMHKDKWFAGDAEQGK
jgi:hypothetical protein